MTYPGQTVPKNPEYGSGKWQPEPELRQGLKMRMLHLYHNKVLRNAQMALGSMILLLVLFGIGAVRTSGGLQFECITDVALVLCLLAVGSFSHYRWIRCGPAVEGLVTSVSDDGVDFLLNVYYEIDKEAYELQIIEKLKTRARRLQPGESITVLLGTGLLTPPFTLLYPPIAQTPSAKQGSSEF